MLRDFKLGQRSRLAAAPGLKHDGSMNTDLELESQSTPLEPASFAVDTPVRVTKGAWAEVVGVVDKLTTSVGGGRTTIVRVPPPTAGEKDVRFVPRSRLVVVDNRHLESIASQ